MTEEEKLFLFEYTERVEKSIHPLKDEGIGLYTLIGKYLAMKNIFKKCNLNAEYEDFKKMAK